MPTRGGVVWITGLPAAGKTTLARHAAERLRELGIDAIVLDGDELRRSLNADLGFSPADRAENVRRVGEVAALMAEAGLVALCALVSPYREDRARVRARLRAAAYFEVYVDTPLEVCQTRDPNGLYARARRGELAGLTGVDAPYEAPAAPDLVVHSGQDGPEACAERLVLALVERGWVSAR